MRKRELLSEVQALADKYIAEQNKRLGPIKLARTSGVEIPIGPWDPAAHAIIEMLRRDQKEAADILARRKPGKASFAENPWCTPRSIVAVAEACRDAGIIPLDEEPSCIPIEQRRDAAKLKLDERFKGFLYPDVAGDPIVKAAKRKAANKAIDLAVEDRLAKAGVKLPRRKRK